MMKATMPAVIRKTFSDDTVVGVPFLEPGLLRVFRFLASLRLALLSVLFVSRIAAMAALWLVGSSSANVQRYQRLTIITFVNLVLILLLIIYLTWPVVQKVTKKWFLPIALVAATVIPIVERLVALLMQTTPLDDALAVNGTWQLIITLLVPLLFIAWQYDFRAVLFFVIASGLLQLGLMLFMAAVAEVPARQFLLNNGLGLLALRSLIYVLIGYLIVRMMVYQREQRNELARANVDLAQYAVTLDQLATSRERNRLARELHDTLAHTLSALSVQLQAMDALWDSDPAKAHSMLQQSIEATHSGLAESRRAIKALRAAPLEDLGLTLALEQLIETVAQRHGLKHSAYISQDIVVTNSDVEQCIYRTTEEALTNVVRHSGAGKIMVTLTHANDRAVLTIRDDGKGFDPDAVDGSHHFGLNGMRERARLVNGKIDISSKPGAGTIVTLHVAC